MKKKGQKLILKVTRISNNMLNLAQLPDAIIIALHIQRKRGKLFAH